VRRIRNAAIGVAVGSIVIRILNGLIEQALPAIFALAILATILAAVFPQPRRYR